MASVLSAVSEQTYCDRLVQDTPFLMGHGRLSEQQVDRIILQLNRYYPQILSNKDAEKVMGGMSPVVPFPLGWEEAELGAGQDSSEVKARLLAVMLGPEHQLCEPQCLLVSSEAAGGCPEMREQPRRQDSMPPCMTGLGVACQGEGRGVGLLARLHPSATGLCPCLVQRFKS